MASGALEPHRSYVSVNADSNPSGLYAAGDVVRGLNQVVVAEAESAVAATDIRKKLHTRQEVSCKPWLTAARYALP
jgi:thioredoxin reductase